MGHRMTLSERELRLILDCLHYIRANAMEIQCSVGEKHIYGPGNLGVRHFRREITDLAGKLTDNSNGSYVAWTKGGNPYGKEQSK